MLFPMKKFFLNSLASYGLVAFTFCSALSSCGSDDDEISSIEGPHFVSGDGNVYQLSNAGKYSFVYDGDGRLISAANLQFSYDPFEVTMPGDKDNDSYEVELSLNSDNNLSSIKLESFDDRGDGMYEKTTGKISYSYNGRRLTKISTDYTTEIKKRYAEGNETGTSVCKITWKGDVITMVQWDEKWKETYTEDGKNFTESEQESRVQKVTYSETPNYYRQGTFALEELYSWESNGLESLILLGMFGDAPAFHIASIETTDSWTRAVCESDGPGSATSTRYFRITNDAMDRVSEERSARTESNLSGSYADVYTYTYKFAPQFTRATTPFVVNEPENTVSDHSNTVRSLFTHRPEPSFLNKIH